MRPIHHRVDDRVRAHLFVCMLAYYVQWHLKRAWLPLMFTDEHLAQHRAERDPVAAAEPSAELKAKKAARQTPDGNELQSFRTLLVALGTRCRNTCHFGEGETAIIYTKLTDPTPLQSEAYRLLDQACSQPM